MSLSSFCVVTNALRLNLVRLYGKNTPQEDAGDTVTLKIKGMMCGHCEARVRTALEAVPEVISAQVSHEKGTAVVRLSAPAAPEVLRNAVIGAGYKVK